MFTLKVKDADKLYLTSDSHVQHFNITKYCHRPFGSRKEMDDALIANWNAVGPNDGIVVHLVTLCCLIKLAIRSIRRFGIN